LKISSTILAKLEAHFAPTRDVLFERYRFHSAEQQPSETVDQFLIRLKHLAETCSFTVSQGLRGVEVIADDILVYGCGATEAEYMQDHDNNLTKLLE